MWWEKNKWVKNKVRWYTSCEIPKSMAYWLKDCVKRCFVYFTGGGCQVGVLHDVWAS